MPKQFKYKIIEKLIKNKFGEDIGEMILNEYCARSCSNKENYDKCVRFVDGVVCIYHTAGINGEINYKGLLNWNNKRLEQLEKYVK